MALHGSLGCIALFWICYCEFHYGKTYLLKKQVDLHDVSKNAGDEVKRPPNLLMFQIRCDLIKTLKPSRAAFHTVLGAGCGWRAPWVVIKYYVMQPEINFSQVSAVRVVFIYSTY